MSDATAAAPVQEAEYDVSSLPGFDEVDDLEIPGFEAKSETPEDTETETSVEPAKAGNTEPESDESSDVEVAATKKPATTEKVAQETKPELKSATAPADSNKRVLKFKAGEQAVELAEDAVVEWKVDGKVTPIKARDLLDNYAGKVAYDRKFQSLDSERRTFESGRENQRKLVTEMYEFTKQGKMFEAVSRLVNATGIKVDVRTYLKDTRDALAAQAQQLAKMSPEQRESYELKEERDYLSAQYEELNQQRKAEEAQKAFQTRLSTVAEQNGITFDDLAQQMEQLKQWSRNNNSDPEAITPEYVVEHRKNIRAYEVARDAIAAVEPELKRGNVITDEARWDKLAELVKAHPSIDQEEFVEMYKKTRQKEQSKAVAKKLKDAPVSTTAKAALQKPKADPNADALDFTKISKEDAIW